MNNNRYGKPAAGWRGDGQQVPGNEPGGANGSYGTYGQDPNAQPPDQPPSQSGMQPRSIGGMLGGAAHGVMQGMQDRLKQSPAGQGIQAMRRYGMPPQQPSTLGPPAQGMPVGNIGNMTNTDDPGAPGPEPMGSSAPPSPDLAGSLASGARMGAPDDMGGDPQMKDGGIITKPTMVMLAEHGQPEAVVPLDGHAGSKVTPGMFSSHRYRQMTGPAMTHQPMGPMAPASLDPHMGNQKASNWKRWDSAHGKG